MPDSDPRYVKTPRPESIQMFIHYVNGHTEVKDINKINNVLYQINKNNGEEIIVYLTNIYTVSEADVIEILSDNQIKVNAIITLSQWNSYTIDAKKYAETQNVGLFVFKEFLGALHFDGSRFIKYRVKKNRFER
jgi:hypothetical protein